MHERCSSILSREEIQDGFYNFYVGNLSRIVIPESMSISFIWNLAVVNVFDAVQIVLDTLDMNQYIQSQQNT